MKSLNQPPDPVTRRVLLGSALFAGLGLAGLNLAGCGQDEPEPSAPPAETPVADNPNQRVLLAFFSRAGENYYNGGRRFLEVGNTKVLAGMISDRIDCDTYEILAADPYPDSYDETVDRNVREQEEDTRPAIANLFPEIGRYDTILLGSPVWNVRAPMIMSTFIEGLDLSGKTILPFVTYAVSGLSGIDDDYRSALPGSDIGAGLAVRGEKVTAAGTELDRWLETSGLTG